MLLAVLSGFIEPAYNVIRSVIAKQKNVKVKPNSIGLIYENTVITMAACNMIYMNNM